MSTFDNKSEDIVTVEEPIAFIDSFKSTLGRDSSNIDASSPISDISSESGTALSVIKKEVPKRKRKNRPGYTTGVQQKRKAELEGLRDQVRQLKQNVEQLKIIRVNASTEHVLNVNPQTMAQQSKWRQIVASEYQERRRSEETNRKLKEILSHQAKVHKSLRQVLHRRSLLQGINFVFGNEPTSTYSFAAFENSKSIMNHLEQKVSALYLESDSVFQSGPTSAISCCMQMKHYKDRGMTAETLSTMTLSCPMEVAADICWKDLSIHRPCPEKWARCMKGSQPNSCEKYWILALQCQSYVKQVKGVQFLRKFVEPNRIVIIKADLMTLNNEELQFRDQTWTIISRSETDPNASVLRVCEQMYLDLQAGGIFSARPEDVAYAQNVVLKNLHWKLREHTIHMQDTLIEETQNYGMVSAAVGV